MTPSDLQSALSEHFAPWVQALGLTIAEAAPTHVTATLPVTDALSRVGGIVSGQALAAATDTVMVLALAAHRGEFVPAATTNLDTQFLGAGRGLLTVRAEVLRAGRRLAFAEARVVGEDGRPVANATATLALP
ncbi:hotdog fold thioesterase [Rhodobacterales bacterium HKCCE2091]|nr:hotdog fold thioesterase [Rhodobacterales bacterium HKCCE2091]